MFIRFFIAGVVALLPIVRVHAQSIVGLGAIPGLERSIAEGFNADASIISGSWYHETGRGQIDACRWIRLSDGSYQRQDLSSSFLGSFSRGGPISADGSTWLAQAFASMPIHHFVLRSVSDGELSLRELDPFPDDADTYWVALEATGSLALGNAQFPDTKRAFTLSNPLVGDSEPELLVLPPGYVSSQANALTTDGSSPVGGCFKADPYVPDLIPVRWSHGAVHILQVPEGSTQAMATGISDDGSTVIGYALDDIPTFHAVLWRGNDPPIDLGLIPGTVRAFPYYVSADGSVVLGWSRDQPDVDYISYPFLWTRRTGILDLNAMIAQFGGEFREWRIESPIGLSSDGRTVLGIGYHLGDGESFVLTLPPLCPADLDNDGDASNGGLPDFAVTIADLLYFLTRFEAGDPRVDLDDGNASGTPDQAVDINDLRYFLVHFEEGC